MDELHKEFVEKYTHYVDVIKDGTQFAQALFKANATFKVGEFPTADSPEAIAAGANAIYSMTKDLKHEALRIHSISRGKIKIKVSSTGLQLHH